MSLGRLLSTKGETFATLEHDGWHCEDPETMRILSDHFPLSESIGLSNRFPRGLVHLQAAARLLRCDYDYDDKERLKAFCGLDANLEFNLKRQQRHEDS